MKSRIRVAQIRGVPEKGNIKGNHARLMELFGSIAGKSVDVVVTPECFLDGYIVTEPDVGQQDLMSYALNPQSDPYANSVARWAANNSAWVILCCMRASEQGVFNSALILDRDGRLCGVYDKTHCQTHDKKFVPGRELRAFQSDFGPFGIMICADRRWPETVRTLALRGARIVFNPSYGMHDERNLRMMQTRSYESEVFIAFTHPRQSLITGPAGDIIINERGDDFDAAVTEIDLSQADVIREKDTSHLRCRRCDLYA